MIATHTSPQFVDLCVARKSCVFTNWTFRRGHLVDRWRLTSQWVEQFLVCKFCFFFLSFFRVDFGNAHLCRTWICMNFAEHKKKVMKAVTSKPILQHSNWQFDGFSIDLWEEILDERSAGWPSTPRCILMRQNDLEMAFVSSDISINGFYCFVSFYDGFNQPSLFHTSELMLRLVQFAKWINHFLSRRIPRTVLLPVLDDARKNTVDLCIITWEVSDGKHDHFAVLTESVWGLRDDLEGHNQWRLVFIRQKTSKRFNFRKSSRTFLNWVRH